MKHALLALVLALGTSTAAQAAAAPIASWSCTAGITGCSFAGDGAFPDEWQCSTGGHPEAATNKRSKK